MPHLWSFDLDGVLAEPPLGWNPAINRDVSLAPDLSTRLPISTPPRGTVRIMDRLLESTWYRFRYVLRPPRAGALGAVQAASRTGRVIVLTGRHERGRAQTNAWLERHGFADAIDELVMNASPLSSPRYKEAYLRGRDASLHIDDDAATCALLARAGIETALATWPRNTGLDFPEHVTRCADLQEVGALIERIERKASDD